ncbi:hypothetical protein LPJ81_001652 [Coemansia sp. IMI 209127]|nr:hypothetical protein LPJ81_001652 [Coemansia sp. IMI 209127]
MADRRADHADPETGAHPAVHSPRSEEPTSDTCTNTIERKDIDTWLERLDIVSIKYSGDGRLELRSSDTWISYAQQEAASVQNVCSNDVLVGIVLNGLEGSARRSFGLEPENTLDGIWSRLRAEFPADEFRAALMARIKSADVFKDIDRSNFVSNFKIMAEEVKSHPLSIAYLGEAIYRMMPRDAWVEVGFKFGLVTKDDLDKCLDKVKHVFDLRPNIKPLPFTRSRPGTKNPPAS